MVKTRSGIWNQEDSGHESEGKRSDQEHSSVVHKPAPVSVPGTRCRYAPDKHHNKC